MERLPNIVVVDSDRRDRDRDERDQDRAAKGEKSARWSGDGAAVARLDRRRRDLRPLEPGSGEIGRARAHRQHPARLLQRPGAQRARRSSSIDGKRYSIPGDFATVEADGQVTLLGRGSIMINTGGEKVFPEEVEGVLKAHPDVFDVLVVGVPDERWGERVTAVVQARAGKAPTVEDLDAHCRTQIAAYKAPKQVFLVEEIRRAPSGKPDYPWAKEYAQAARRGADADVGSAPWTRRGSTPTTSRPPGSTTPTRPTRPTASRCSSTSPSQGVDLEAMRAADAVGSLHAGGVGRRGPSGTRAARRARSPTAAGLQRRPAPAGRASPPGSRSPTTTTASPTRRRSTSSHSAPQLFGDEPTLRFTRAMGSSLASVADAAISLFLVLARGSDAAAGTTAGRRGPRPTESAVDALGRDPGASWTGSSVATCEPSIHRQRRVDRVRGGARGVPARDRVRRPGRVHAATPRTSPRPSSASSIEDFEMTANEVVSPGRRPRGEAHRRRGDVRRGRSAAACARSRSSSCEPLRRRGPASSPHAGVGYGVVLGARRRLLRLGREPRVAHRRHRGAERGAGDRAELVRCGRVRRRRSRSSRRADAS